MPSITPRQIKAARALLGWRQSDLADKAGMVRSTLHRIEKGESRPRIDTMDLIERTLTDAGIEFTETGVSWRAG